MVIVVFEYISEKAITLPFSKSVTKDSESNVSLYIYNILIILIKYIN